MNPRDPTWFYYPDSAWWNLLFETGYQFEVTNPADHARRCEALPADWLPGRSTRGPSSLLLRYRDLTAALPMGLPVSARSISLPVCINKQYLDGGRTYKVMLPKDIPEAGFWSFTLYDNQTRSMLDTPQRYPRAGNQSYPSPAAEPSADGSTSVYFGPKQPDGVKRGNWI